MVNRMAEIPMGGFFLSALEQEQSRAVRARMKILRSRIVEDYNVILTFGVGNSPALTLKMVRRRSHPAGSSAYGTLPVVSQELNANH